MSANTPSGDAVVGKQVRHGEFVFIHGFVCHNSCLFDWLYMAAIDNRQQYKENLSRSESASTGHYSKAFT